MTTELTDDDIRSRLNLEHVYSAAHWAADVLHGAADSAIVDLAPGDHTKYRIAVLAPQFRWTGRDARTDWHGEYLVTLVNCSGATYPWNGQVGVHPSYAAAKWTTDGARWTGVVLAAFLNALAGYLADR